MDFVNSDFRMAFASRNLFASRLRPLEVISKRYHKNAITKRPHHTEYMISLPSCDLPCIRTKAFTGHLWEE